MSWMVFDDQASTNRKFQALKRKDLAGDPEAGAAVSLWAMAGSRMKAAHVDGVLDVVDLLELFPDRDRVLRRAELLVEVGLWHDHDHYCGRCPRPGPGRWAFHDWRRYHKPAAIDLCAEALRAERNDPSLAESVWQRDRLPDGTPQVPGGDVGAHCAYCGRLVLRSHRSGEGGAELDHVIPRAYGADNLVVACRACNKKKGNRTAAAAGMTLHLTAAHEAALARRGDSSRSPDGGPAGLRAMMLGVAGVPALDWVVDPLDEAPTSGLDGSHEDGSAGPGAEEGSHPTGFAGPPPAPGSHPSSSAGPSASPSGASCSHDVEPPPVPGAPASGVGGPAGGCRDHGSQGGGSSVPTAPTLAAYGPHGGSVPVSRVESAQEPVWAFTPQADGQWAVHLDGYDQKLALGAETFASAPVEKVAEIILAACGLTNVAEAFDAAVRALELARSSRAHACERTRAGARSHERTRAGRAGQGRAGRGKEGPGQGGAGPGSRQRDAPEVDERPGRRRKRRRGKGKR